MSVSDICYVEIGRVYVPKKKVEKEQKRKEKKHVGRGGHSKQADRLRVMKQVGVVDEAESVRAVSGCVRDRGCYNFATRMGWLAAGS